MRVLIDTNVLADVLLGRDPYYDIAYRILAMCADKKIYGYMAAHSIPNLFYILRKSMTKEERREALKDICQIIKVEGIDSFKIISALDNGTFDDFEDCLRRVTRIVRYLIDILDMQYPISWDLRRIYDYLIYDLGLVRAGRERRFDEIGRIRHILSDLAPAAQDLAASLSIIHRSIKFSKQHFPNLT